VNRDVHTTDHNNVKHRTDVELDDGSNAIIGTIVSSILVEK